MKKGKISRMRIGKNCKISDKISIYGEENIEIGDNVRIDEFSILVGGSGLKIGSHVHIAAYSILYGTAGLTIGDFTGCAVRTTILSALDDYHGFSLIGPCVSMKFKPRLLAAPVNIGRHVVLGVGCVVLPGVNIGDGASFGAYSLIKKDCLAWSIYAGLPVKRICDRDRKVLELEKKFLEEYNA